MAVVRYHMVTNKVRFIADDVALVEKGSSSVIVLKENTTVMIVRNRCLVDGVPFVPLIKECVDIEAAHNEFLRLVGKMCSKQPDSKYFESPNVEEHLVNGNPNPSKREVYISMARDSQKYV